MNARQKSRDEAKKTGRTKPSSFPAPEIARGGDIMRTREANRKKLAATQREDANAETDAT